jgi:predicted RNase H-like nuclease (RuvC/YqgF family)
LFGPFKKKRLSPETIRDEEITPEAVDSWTKEELQAVYSKKLKQLDHRFAALETEYSSLKTEYSSLSNLYATLEAKHNDLTGRVREYARLESEREKQSGGMKS